MRTQTLSRRKRLWFALMATALAFFLGAAALLAADVRMTHIVRFYVYR